MRRLAGVLPDASRTFKVRKYTGNCASCSRSAYRSERSKRIGIMCRATAGSIVDAYRRSSSSPYGMSTRHLPTLAVRMRSTTASAAIAGSLSIACNILPRHRSSAPGSKLAAIRLRYLLRRSSESPPAMGMGRTGTASSKACSTTTSVCVRERGRAARATGSIPQ